MLIMIGNDDQFKSYDQEKAQANKQFSNFLAFEREISNVIWTFRKFVAEGTIILSKTLKHMPG